MNYLNTMTASDRAAITRLTTGIRALVIPSDHLVPRPSNNIALTALVMAIGGVAEKIDPGDKTRDGTIALSLLTALHTVLANAALTLQVAYGQGTPALDEAFTGIEALIDSISGGTAKKYVASNKGDAGAFDSYDPADPEKTTVVLREISIAALTAGVAARDNRVPTMAGFPDDPNLSTGLTNAAFSTVELGMSRWPDKFQDGMVTAAIASAFGLSAQFSRDRVANRTGHTPKLDALIRSIAVICQDASEDTARLDEWASKNRGVRHGN